MHPLSVQFVLSKSIIEFWIFSSLHFFSWKSRLGSHYHWKMLPWMQLLGPSFFAPSATSTRPWMVPYVIVRSSSAWLLLIPQLTLCFLFHFPFPSEVMRVLKPGGFYVFVEHVAAKGAYLLRLLHRMNTILSFMNDDCFVLFQKEASRGLCSMLLTHCSSWSLMAATSPGTLRRTYVRRGFQMLSLTWRSCPARRL